MHIRGNIGTELKLANVESQELEARYRIKSQVRHKKGFKFIWNCETVSKTTRKYKAQLRRRKAHPILQFSLSLFHEEQ